MKYSNYKLTITINSTKLNIREIHIVYQLLVLVPFHNSFCSLRKTADNSNCHKVPLDKVAVYKDPLTKVFKLAFTNLKGIL